MASFNSSRWALVLFVAPGSVTYGYCSSIISTTLGQPSFQLYFELNTRSNTAGFQGAINGLYYAGGLIGTLCTAHTGDAFGRRMAMFIGGTFSWVGGALQAGSVHIAMFMAARFVTGIGIGMLLCLVPLYQSEFAPPKIRGLLVGTHGAMLLRFCSDEATKE
ncbi:hypothetical protein FDECE_4891 [Fusarium decemcellulare]|nr:hypothetical protein FDECE_4891 [Fusarium decemcellulare]